MKKEQRWLCLVCILIGLWLVGCSGSDSGDGEPEDVVVVPVEVAEVTAGNISAYFSGTATLEAEEETAVVAKVGGVVEELLVEEGDDVRAGQAVAKLDDEKLSVQLEQAIANLQKLENAYQRSEELFNKNLISAEEFQKAKYEYEHQKAAFDLVKLDLEYTSIRTPISGVVAERMIKVGNMVLPNQETFRVTGFDPLLAVLYVPERQMGKLKVGHPARLRVDALTDESFPGHIERISPIVDPSTGTMKVTVEVRDASRSLKPGMFARVDITHDVHTDALLVPKDAIMTEDRETSVFVIQDSLAFRRVIELGYVNTTHVEVVSGVSVGETVVTTGKGGLKDSTRVAFVSALEEIAVNVEKSE